MLTPRYDRLARRLSRIEERRSPRPRRVRRYFFYEDEIAEMAEAKALGLSYAVGPRVCATSEEWERKYGASTKGECVTGVTRLDEGQ
jgi:hypothetical protein